MKKKFKISVIIPTRNEEKYLSLCLDSLIKQKYKPFEVIIVDNKSTDRTVEIVKDYQTKIKNLIITKSKDDLIGAIRQRGFERASGDILVSADADSLFPPDWLLNIVNYFKNHPSVIAIGGPYKFYDEDRLIKILRQILTPIFLFIDLLLSKGKHHFAACNFAIYHDAFWQVGGFNPHLGFGEDVDLAVRLRRIGEVKFLKSLLISTSCRRYQKGIIKGIIKESVVSFLIYLKIVFLSNIIWPLKEKLRIANYTERKYNFKK